MSSTTDCFAIEDVYMILLSIRIERCVHLQFGFELVMIQVGHTRPLNTTSGPQALNVRNSHVHWALQAINHVEKQGQK